MIANTICPGLCSQSNTPHYHRVDTEELTTPAETGRLRAALEQYHRMVLATIANAEDDGEIVTPYWRDAVTLAQEALAVPAPGGQAQVKKLPEEKPDGQS